MPQANQHTRQAEHNRRLILELDPATTEFLDWVVTAAFYTALHRLEAWFAGMALDGKDHGQRDDWIVQFGALRGKVHQLYKDLQHYSEDARYRCQSFDRDFVLNSVLSDLEEIECAIAALPSLF